MSIYIPNKGPKGKKVTMSVRSVEEIIRLSDSHSNPNRIAYKHLLKQLDSQIRERAVRHGSLSFRTPSILFGKPAFEKDSVEKKIVKHYSRIGFACYKNLDGDIIIRWKEEETHEAQEDVGSNGSTSDSGSDIESGSEPGSFEQDQGQDQDQDRKGSNSNPDSDSDSDDGKDTSKRVVIETQSLSKRMSGVGK